MQVRSNGTSVRARVEVRERIRPGTAFLIEGTATDNANVSTALRPWRWRSLPPTRTPGREAEAAAGP